MTVTQGIKLDEDIRNRLKALGKIRNRTPHWIMKTAIQDYLEREEHNEREKGEDRERWQNYQLTGESVTHKDAVLWLTDLAQGKVKPCPK
jgi:predicted transcriptional regulator